jgi:hypothetical protein
MSTADLKLTIIRNCERMNTENRLKVLRYLIDAIDLPARICENGDGCRINLDMLCDSLLLEVHNFVDDIAREVPVEFQIE